MKLHIDSRLLKCLSTHIVACVALMFSANMTIAIVIAWESLTGILAIQKRTLEFSTFPKTLTTAQLMTLNILNAIKPTRRAAREPASERSVVGLDMFASNILDQLSCSMHLWQK